MAERAIAWVGAVLGLVVTGLVARSWVGVNTDLPLLISPIGASTVLVFGVVYCRW